MPFSDFFVRLYLVLTFLEFEEVQKRMYIRVQQSTLQLPTNIFHFKFQHEYHYFGVCFWSLLYAKKAFAYLSLSKASSSVRHSLTLIELKNFCLLYCKYISDLSKSRLLLTKTQY